MAFIFKCVFLFAFSCSVFTIKTFASSMYRTDQVLPFGCSLRWDGYRSFFSKVFHSTSRKNELQLTCDGVNIDYWYTDLGSADLTWSLFGNCGRISDMCRSGYEAGIWWVTGARIDPDGSGSVHVCNSFFALFWMQESCRWISENQTDASFNINIGTLSAFRMDVDEIHSGMSKDTSSDAVNRGGYMFTMFTNDNPYDGTYGNNGSKNIISGKTIENNCQLLRDFNIPDGCPDINNCSCVLPHEPDIPSCESCYTQDQKDGSILPTGCSKGSDGGYTICDSTHTTDCCEDSGLIHCDKYRIPVGMDPTCTDSDKSKCYFDSKVRALTPIQKQCYGCNATAQTIYNNCTSGVNNRYSNSLNLPDLQSKTMFGAGSYICAAFNTGTYNLRAGCSKIPLGVPPKYFPRIATNNNPQISNLFQPVASVRRFRDYEYSRSKTQFGVCGYGPAELGEQSRGNFFTPYMQVVFGENDQQIKFTVNTLTDMSVTYGAISAGDRVNGVVYGPWNTSSPVQVHHGAKDSNCSNLVLDTSNIAYICTRIEFDGEDDAGYYTAYQVTQTGNVALTPASVGSCSSHCANASACPASMINIGRVPRPPLRYGYTTNGTPLMPLSVSSANVGVDPAAPNVVTLNPVNSRTDFPQNLVGLQMMQVSLIPQYYDVEHSQVISANSASYVNSVIPSSPCAMLFGHQYCLTRDLCSLLWDYDVYCSTAICKSRVKSACGNTDTFCKTYQTLIQSCGNKTYCNNKYATVASCMNYKPSKLINIAISGASSTMQDLSYYQKNVQWQDESCISSGFAQAHHSSTSTNSVTDDLQYGNSGSVLYDQVIAFKNTDTRNTARRPMRISAWDDDNANSTIIPVSPNIKTPDDAAMLLSNALDSSGINIAQKYFDTVVPAAISPLIAIRNRTMREMNLCGVNFRDTFNDWSTVFRPGPGWYDIYLPLRCQIFEYGIKGGQGGGTNLTSFASEHYWFVFDYGCKWSDGHADDTCVACGNGHYGTGYTQWAECTWKSESYGLDMYNSSTGSMGGKSYGITNNLTKQNEFLSFFIGNGANIYETTRENYCNNDCHGPDKALHGCANCSIITTYKCPYKGISYRGANSSYLTPISAIPSANLEDTSVAGSMYDSLSYARGDAGSSNSEKCVVSATLNGGLAMDNLNIATTPNVYGDNSFFAQTSTGTGVYVGSAGVTEVAGNNGSAYIAAAKIIVNAVSAPVYINNYNKQLGTSHGSRDPECTPMCPRINIKVPILVGSSSADYICEYGGVGYDLNDLFTTLDKYDFQVPAGFTAIPTRCFSVIDGGKTLIHPTRDYFNASCSTTYTITDNNRWYGMCANSDVKTNYLKEFFLNTKNYFAMAGVYCPGNNCASVEPIDNRNNQNIIYNANLLDQQTYGLKCLSGGMWANTYGGSASPIRRIADANLQIKCPPISDKLSFSSWWSANATWPLSSPGVIASGTCMDGYIPYSSTSGISRKCGVSGIWGAIDNINQNVCLYTCQPKTDTVNSIKWDSPASFNNPVSIPTCLMGPGTIYVSSNGNIQPKTISMVYTADTGRQLSDFALTCNMPGASSPLSYLDVGQYTTNTSRIPSWGAVSLAAKCVPPSFSGSCIVPNSSNVCYDAGATGNLTFATCNTGFIYQVNGIPTYPPKQRISGSTLVPATITTLNMIEDSETISCTINGPTGNGSSATCNSLDVNLKISYYDYFTGATYKKSISIFTAANTTVSNFPAQNISTAITNKLISNIANNIPSNVSGCTIYSSLASNPSDPDLLDYMVGHSYCGNLCYAASPLPGQQSLQFFDCTAISSMPSNMPCKQICGSNSETYYYYYGNGYGLSTSDGTNQSDNNTYGIAHTLPLTASNSQYCIQQGIIKAALATGGQSVIGAVSSYCTSAVYSASMEIIAGTEVSASINNSAFASKFIQSDLSCWAPRNCILPNGIGTLNHQNSVWNFVFDSAHGFTYSATLPQSCAPSSGQKYNVVANNTAFFKLYCYDGNLFKIEEISGSTLNYSGMTTNCFSSVPQLTDFTTILTSSFMSDISNLPSIKDPETLVHNIVMDNTANSFATYHALVKLDIDI